MSVALLVATIGAGSVDAGPSGGALPPPLIQILQVAGRHGVPIDVSMVAVNVTVVNTAEPGFVTVFACDEDEPSTSNVNYLADQVVPNLVMSRVSSDGTICVATSAVTDAIVDIVGYVPSGSAVTPLAAPVRRLDTREPGGPPSPVPAGTTTEIQITGLDGIPADATLVMFNATAIGGGDPGFVTAFPCGDLPGTSSVNHLANQIVANFVTSRISATGTLCLFNLATADVVVDVVAYATGGITPLAVPQRIVDTRLTGSGPQPQAGTLTLDIAGRADVPDDATAAVYNLTSVEAAGPGFATSYPCDVALPGVSNLNYAPGQVVANGAITKLSAGGELCIFNLAPTHLIVDLIGYTRGTDDYVPITPQRIWDSREGWQSACPWILTGDAAGPTLVATNTLTGEQRTMSRSLPRAEVPPFVLPDCTGVAWVEGGANARWDMRIMKFNGSDPAGFEVSPSARVAHLDATILEDGRYVAVRAGDGAVVDLMSGDVVFAPNWLGQPLNASIVPAGFVAAREGSALGGAPFIETFDVLEGARIAAFTIQEAVNTVELSPDGTLLALDSGRALLGTALVVVTTAGVFVHSMTSQSSTYQRLSPRFDGSGTMIVCVQDTGLFRYDLFAQPAPIAAWGDWPLFSPVANDECLTQFWR